MSQKRVGSCHNSTLPEGSLSSERVWCFSREGSKQTRGGPRQRRISSRLPRKKNGVGGKLGRGSVGREVSQNGPGHQDSGEN